MVSVLNYHRMFVYTRITLNLLNSTIYNYSGWYNRGCGSIVCLAYLKFVCSHVKTKLNKISKRFKDNRFFLSISNFHIIWSSTSTWFYRQFTCETVKLDKFNITYQLIASKFYSIKYTCIKFVHRHCHPNKTNFLDFQRIYSLLCIFY